MKRRFLLPLTLCIFFFFIQATPLFGQCEEAFQTLWGLRNGNAIQVTHAAYTTQKDLVVGGTTASKGIIVHFDKTNSVKWAKTFAAGNTVSFRRIIVMADGGVTAVGAVSENNVFSLIVVRLNAAGTVLWTKRLHDISQAAGLTLRYLLTESIAETPDGGIAICGRKYYMRNADGQSNYRMFVCKLGATGTIDWTREDTYGNDDEAFGLLVDQGAIVVVGTTYSVQTGIRYGFLEKLNPVNGDVLWLKRYQLGNLQSNWFRSIEKWSGGYEIATQGFAFSQKVYNVLRTNSDGNEVECKKLPSFGPDLIDQYYYTVPLPDGSSVLWKDQWHIATEAHLAKVSSGRTAAWQFEYTLPGTQKLAKVLPDGNSSALAVGSSPQTPNMPEQIYLLKVTPNGTVGNCVANRLDLEVKDSLHYSIIPGTWQTTRLNFQPPHELSPVVEDVTLQATTLCRSNGCQVNGIDIEGDKMICTPGDMQTYKVRVGGTCNIPAQWTLDNPIGSIQQLNDSMINIRFTAPGSAMLRATVTTACATNFNQIFLTYRPEAVSVNLGSDTAICKGDTLTLSAGNYPFVEWMNGAKGQTLEVFTGGTYSVAVSQNGNCFIKDTIVITIKERPAINLQKDTVICKPEVRVLDAGAGFAGYLWQDGSARSTFSVQDIGTYWVKVTDRNGCFSSDTVRIKGVYDRPVDFMPVTDTAICSGEKLLLQTTGGFKEYSWNNDASINPGFEVDQPGTYHIKVLDSNGCKGEESIVVRDKGCLQSIHIPNAFTPNNDGLNDVFKPSVKGMLESYELLVFNRWGELVYQSNDIRQGWNGVFRQTHQLSGVYAWYLRYRFTGNTHVQEKKGTVLLVR